MAGTAPTLKPREGYPPARSTALAGYAASVEYWCLLQTHGKCAMATRRDDPRTLERVSVYLALVTQTATAPPAKLEIHRRLWKRPLSLTPRAPTEVPEKKFQRFDESEKCHEAERQGEYCGDANGDGGE
jgi:hypothetical protein